MTIMTFFDPGRTSLFLMVFWPKRRTVLPKEGRMSGLYKLVVDLFALYINSDSIPKFLKCLTILEINPVQWG